MLILAHEGAAAFRKKYEMVHRHRADRPNATWQADHTELDILDARGRPARPWLTTVVDDHSCAVAGYMVFLGAPSALNTSLALRQAIWRKADPAWRVCGIPDVLHVDHGSDFTSPHLEQAAADLRIRLIYPAVARSRGRCQRGERLRMGYPHGHRKTTTLVAGLRMTGMVAPMVLDGPINGDRFEAYVGQILVPGLRRGDVVIMDNLSSHKRASVRALIEAAGARILFLPPYSPDFNPIEKAFSRLKAMLRKAGKRTASGPWSLIGKPVDLFQPQECANYFTSCGYDPD